MAIDTFPLGPLQTNSYLVHADGMAVAVDVGGDPAPMLDFAAGKGLRITDIILTHLHFDHVYGVAALAEATGAAVHIPAQDRCLLDTESGKGGIWGFPPVPAYEGKDIARGDHTLAGMNCTILDTPGHTPGGICLLDRKDRLLFTGDSVIEQTWMQMDESLPMHVFLDSLESLGKIRSAFDYILTGHTRRRPEDASLCEAQRRAVREVIDGQDEGDMPYEWYGGLATAHPYGPEPRRIVYRRDRLEKERKETAK